MGKKVCPAKGKKIQIGGESTPRYEGIKIEGMKGVTRARKEGELRVTGRRASMTGGGEESSAPSSTEKQRRGGGFRRKKSSQEEGVRGEGKPGPAEEKKGGIGRFDRGEKKEKVLDFITLGKKKKKGRTRKERSSTKRKHVNGEERRHLATGGKDGVSSSLSKKGGDTEKDRGSIT